MIRRAVGALNSPLIVDSWVRVIEVELSSRPDRCCLRFVSVLATALVSCTSAASTEMAGAPFQIFLWPATQLYTRTFRSTQTPTVARPFFLRVRSSASSGKQTRRVSIRR